MVLPGMNAVLDEYLRFLSDGQPRTNNEVLEHFYKKFEMTRWEKRDRTKGGVVKIKSRHNWAKSNLKSSGLVIYLPHKQVQITPKGREMVLSKPTITPADLRGVSDVPIQDMQDNEGYDEQIEDLVKIVKKNQCDDALSRLSQMDPYDFERLLLDLLGKMGYGKGSQTPKSRDGGIDGVVLADRLGFEKVYVQAKQQKAPVSPGDVREFAGAISAQKSQKGVFITTSDFSDNARAFAADAGSNIVLINGSQLAEHMYDLGVGFDKKELDLKQLNNDYFDSDEA